MHGHKDDAEADLGEEQYGPFSGQVLAASRLACSKAMMAAGPRAKVIREEMREGSDFFTIHAYLPVADSKKNVRNLEKQVKASEHRILPRK
eukprot:jgi/Pico_ML_1/50730/g1887.t2